MESIMCYFNLRNEILYVVFFFLLYDKVVVFYRQINLPIKNIQLTDLCYKPL